MVAVVAISPLLAIRLRTASRFAAEASSTGRVASRQLFDRPGSPLQRLLAGVLRNQRGRPELRGSSPSSTRMACGRQYLRQRRLGTMRPWRAPKLCHLASRGSNRTTPRIGRSTTLLPAITTTGAALASTQRERVRSRHGLGKFQRPALLDGSGRPHMGLP